VLKPPKVYFFDNGDVLGDEGARFENLVATSLLKRLHFLEDRDGYRYELRYIRDKEGREVDFVIVKEGELEELIEAKLIVATIKRPYDKNQIKVIDPVSYFQNFF
jgi:predicted AAA+ superfamily ATPase